MRLLVISPDYASHALPMIQVASAWARTRGEAIVATGDSTRPLVEQAGLISPAKDLDEDAIERVLRADRRLTEAQCRALLAVYRSYVEDSGNRA